MGHSGVVHVGMVSLVPTGPLFQSVDWTCTDILSITRQTILGILLVQTQT